ncbi:MAG: alkaline phosphatase [Bacteroidetes bacterium]|nr:MAG: alkaline phosphatase [Bacteroidota bacterium]
MRHLTFYFSCCILLACNQPVQKSTTGSSEPPGATTVNYIPNAKNIIFLIGDGMGLTQITAGMYLNGNKTALEKFPVVGLHKSHSENNLVTDSAAGATAFASGIKTVNGALGMDHLGQNKETILEEAERKGLATGLLTTSTIVHATPAAFITHVRSRRLYEEIALGFMNTDIDLMIGGGKAYFTRREDGRDLYQRLRDRNYYVADYFDTEIDEINIQGGENLAYFTSDKDPLPKDQGRDYLPPATELALDFLEDRSGKGFFLMIEGAQIDWGGHANNIDYIVDEFHEFDKVVDMCIEFAKKNGETLVIVTADHETGGLAINPESTMRKLETAFTTGGHTATMIPVFAYGPGADRFAGIYDNTKIYTKMRQAYGWRR